MAFPVIQDQTRKTPGDTRWFVESRFGMFIHWGLYALPARHEWVKQRESIADSDYAKYFKHFDPDLYDPDEWASAAAAAGMKYMIVTSKHHEGFCLWNSQFTDYNAMNTPAKRDLLRPMLDSFRGHGLRTGLYYSLIDWHHPHFTADHLHATLREGLTPENVAEVNKGRDQSIYIEYMRNQVRELLTDYGQIDMLWFDFSYPSEGDRIGKGKDDWGSEALVKMIRELNPGIILNDRLDVPDAWDVKTPEQHQPTGWMQVDGQPVVWEACQTFSGSWGYHRDENTWRSLGELIRTLIDCVSKGGNLLLNVGPTGRGEFDARALDRLWGMGDWMQQHGRAIYGCTQAPDFISASGDTRLTYNPDTHRLYIHLTSYPYKALHVGGIKEHIEYAQLLHDASELRFRQRKGQEVHGALESHVGDDVVTIRLPQTPPSVEVPVVEIMLKDR